MTAGASRGASAPALAAGAALLLSAAGCGGPGAGSGPVAVRDSAGVTIVENDHAPGEVPRWSLGGAPILDLGSAEGPPELRFRGVTGARRLSDGRWAVLDGQSGELRLYGTRGGFLEAAGGEGDGPGALGAPFGLWIARGDSLLVWDREGERGVIYAPDGSFGREFRPALPTSNSRAFGVLEDGSVLLLDHRFDFGGLRPGGVTEIEVVHLRYGPGGEEADTVGRGPYAEMGIFGSGEDAMASSPIFAPRTSEAAGGRRAWIGTAREYEVVQHDLLDGGRRRIRWRGPGRRVEAPDVRRYIEAELRQAEPEERRRLSRRLESVPVADRFPAYLRLVADREDHLWVRPYPRPAQAEAPAWWVFDPRGRLVARVDVPGGLLVLDIGAGHVLGVGRDSLGVEHVRAYGLSRESAGEAPGSPETGGAG